MHSELVTPEQLDLVEWSLVVLDQRLDDASAAFYDRLFDLDPSIRALFADDLAAQRRKFGVELAFIVSAIRSFDRFVAAAADLGERHARRNVRAGHVQTAGIAPIDALRTTLDEAWTPPLEEAWSLAYRLISEVMMAGAAAVPPR